MNKDVIYAIAKKDIHAITSNIQIWLGMIIAPIALCGVIPAILILVAKSVDLSSNQSLYLLLQFVDSLPEGELKDMIDSFPSINHKVIYIFANYFVAPLFLFIPAITSMLIAANSFVGEKERRTLETLLFAPIRIKDLFIGKVLSAFVPALAITIISFLLFGIVVNSLAFPMFESLIFPNWNWIVLVFWVSPIISLVTILINLLISARVKGFQEAQQLGGLVVLPIVALLISQASGIVLVDTSILAIIGGILLLINLFLLNKISKMNQRHVLFEKQVH